VGIGAFISVVMSFLYKTYPIWYTVFVQQQSGDRPESGAAEEYLVCYKDIFLTTKGGFISCRIDPKLQEF
jgi:hypothetical protein